MCRLQNKHPYSQSHTHTYTLGAGTRMCLLCISYVIYANKLSEIQIQIQLYKIHNIYHIYVCRQDESRSDFGQFTWK